MEYKTMTNELEDYNHDSWNELESWLETWINSDTSSSYGEFELAYGVVLELDWHEDDPTFVIDVLLTEEPHYLKRSWNEPLADNSSTMNELVDRLNDVFKNSGFNHVDLWFEYDERNSTVGIERWTASVENPQYDHE